MARINKTQYALLGLLSMRGPSTGYEMKGFIDESLNYFWQENYGHIYPVLKKLEEKELVTCREEPSPGKPPRKVYTITEKGSESLEAWLLSPLEGMKYRNELLLRLFFMAEDKTEKINEMIRREEELHQALLEEYGKVEKHILEKHGEVPSILCTVRYGKKISEATLEWCRETAGMWKKESEA